MNEQNNRQYFLQKVTIERHNRVQKHLLILILVD